MSSNIVDFSDDDEQSKTQTQTQQQATQQKQQSQTSKKFEQIKAMAKGIGPSPLITDETIGQDIINLDNLTSASNEQMQQNTRGRSRGRGRSRVSRYRGSRGAAGAGRGYIQNNGNGNVNENGNGLTASNLAIHEQQMENNGNTNGNANNNNNNNNDNVNGNENNENENNNEDNNENENENKENENEHDDENGEASGDFPTYEEQKELDARSAFVKNIPLDAEVAELQTFFSACGSIDRITIVEDKHTHEPKGCAYVQFKQAEAVDEALLLNDKPFKGQKISVQRKRTNLPWYLRQEAGEDGEDTGYGPNRGRGRGRGYRGRGRARGGRGGYRGRGGGGFYRGRGRGRARGAPFYPPYGSEYVYVPAPPLGYYQQYY